MTRFTQAASRWNTWLWALALVAAPATAAAPTQAPATDTSAVQVVASDAADTQLQREQAAWNQAYQQSARTQLRAVAARGDARSLLAAAMLWQWLADASADRPATDPRQQARGWFDAARAVRPGDPLVTWVEAMDCGGLSDRCQPRQAVQMLQRAEADNLAVHLRALVLDHAAGDTAQVEQDWRLAAQASRYDAHVNDIGRLLRQTLREVPAPMPSAAVAEEMGRTAGLARPATTADAADIISLGVTYAVALPNLGLLARTCQRPPDEQRRGQCVAILQVMNAGASDFMLQSLSLSLLVQLEGDSAAGRQRREQLRQASWQSQHFATLLTSGQAVTDTYLDELLEDGELAIARRWMQARGIPLQPPPDWLPDNPSYSSLITTGTRPVAPQG